MLGCNRQDGKGEARLETEPENWRESHETKDTSCRKWRQAVSVQKKESACNLKTNELGGSLGKQRSVNDRRPRVVSISPPLSDSPAVSVDT